VKYMVNVLQRDVPSSDEAKRGLRRYRITGIRNG